MEAINKLSRPMKYALMSALAAGIVSAIMITTFIDMFSWLFIPSVMIMVFISAYYAFRRQMLGKGALNGKRILGLAAEVGTLTHFYTFALYFPLNYLIYDFRPFSADLAGIYVVSFLFIGFVSIIMFVWIAVPMYLGVGYLQQSMEKNLSIHDHIDDKLILDSLSESDA